MQNELFYNYYRLEKYEDLLKFGYDQLDEKQSMALMNTRVDYLGPLIDMGFRLAEKYTPRKMVISVELAYLLG
jgi:hypothetical protein